MVDNPCLRISFPPGEDRPSIKMRFRLENLSIFQEVAYKVKTLVSDLDLFVVSPNPGRVPAGSSCEVVLRCRSPGSIAGPARRAKFVVAYGAAEVRRGRGILSSLPFSQAFGVQVTPGGFLSPSGSSLAGIRRAVLKEARSANLLCSTPSRNRRRDRKEREGCSSNTNLKY